MNLEESNKFYQNNKQKDSKKQTIKGGIIFCIFIIIICLLGIVYLNSKEANRFKNILNGKEIFVHENFIVNDEEGKLYVNVKQLADFTGYTYNQGEKYNEDKNSCYLENKYEMVTFKVDEKNFYKYIKNKIDTTIEEEENDDEQQTQPATDEPQALVYTVKSEDGEKEIFSIEDPIKLINEQIYIPINIVNLACNSTLTLNEKNMQINSLDYLVQIMQQFAGENEYESISSVYENLRAIPNNMLVVGKNGKYGVISLVTGETILSIKYDDIKYIQSENRFYVYIDSKVGILDAEGNTIIAPTEYNSIKVFDEDKKWFLVEKDRKYGIIGENGEIVLQDFDGIGLEEPEKYNTDDLKNKNIWFDKIVVVKKGQKYGLYDLEKREALTDYEFDGFGYKTTSTDKSSEESLLIIPRETGVEGIVVQVGGLYGIYDINLKGLAIPCACSRMYYIINNGISTYYMEFSGTQLPMKEYFKEKNMVTVR